MLKGLGDLGKLGGVLKQAMEMKGRIDELKAGLEDERVEASVGGGLVSVTMNGNLRIVSLSIQPDIITRDDPQALEGLITAAVNLAIEKTQEMVQSKMKALTGGINIPGLT